MRILANIKQVSVKNLVSGDQELRVVLSVVGDEQIREALELGKLAPEDQVIISNEV